MPFVIRQIHAPGKSARADEAGTVALTLAAVAGTVKLGVYLEWSNPDANRGLGDDGWTNDVTKAKRFDTFIEAMECWRAQSTVKPLRADGKPNRPMTAFSVTVEEVQ